MKACDYCGRENEDALVYCTECGTAFPPRIPPIIPSTEPPVIESPFLSPPPPGPGVLNGGTATAVFGVFLATQFAVGLLVGIFGSIFFHMQSNEQSGAMDTTQMTQAIMPSAIFFATILSGVGTIWTARAFRLPLNDTTPTGAAWVRGSWGDIAKGLATGIGVAALWFIVVLSFGFNNHSKEMGPLTRMSATPGIARMVWIITAMFLAPPIEELVFRGIVYGGYRKSMGAVAAAVLTTVIFVLLHFTEFIHEPIAIFGITNLALAALWQRLRSRAIGPAIATHFAYNSTIVLGTLLSEYFS